jgi:hypothetical protein
MTTNEAVEVLVEVLAPYIGDTMARSATEVHCQKLGLAGGTVTSEQMDALLGKLGGGLNIFLGRDKSASVVTEARRALAARGGA